LRVASETVYGTHLRDRLVAWESTVLNAAEELAASFGTDSWGFAVVFDAVKTARAAFVRVLLLSTSTADWKRSIASVAAALKSITANLLSDGSTPAFGTVEIKGLVVAQACLKQMEIIYVLRSWKRLF
jgi:hypothetical protein